MKVGTKLVQTRCPRKTIQYCIACAAIQWRWIGLDGVPSESHRVGDGFLVAKKTSNKM